MKQVASLRYGVIFKKAFSNPDIFKAFVKDFLGIELVIDKVEMEKSFTIPIGNVDTRFDLFAEDKQNRVIVDIQHVRYGDNSDRFLHYHCAALLEQVASSKDYRPSLKVFTIDEYSLEQVQLDKFEKGKTVGKKEGLKEGLEQGQQQKALEIARSLLAEGLDPAIVAKTTGLSSDDLANLSY
jgi:hypothetical protein